MSDNGDVLKPKSTIQVIFDPETHVVGVQFRPEEFRTWDYVISILDQAKRQCTQILEDQRLLIREQAKQEQRRASNVLARQLRPS